MALTEKYVSALAGGSGDGLSAGTAFTFSQMIANIIADGGIGTRYNIKADGTYARTATDDISGKDGTDTGPIVMRGYKTVIGDGYLGRTGGNQALITTNMPLVTYSTGANMSGGKGTILESINFEGDLDYFVVKVVYSSLIIACRVKNINTGPNAAVARVEESGIIWECDCFNTGTTGGGSAVDLAGNMAKADSCRIICSSPTGNGISVDTKTVVYGCLIKGAGGTSGSKGIANAWDDRNTFIRNNTITGFTDGIYTLSTGHPMFIAGNMITGNTWGVNFTAIGNRTLIGPNRMRDNTSGNSRFPGGNWQDVGKLFPLVTTDTGGDETDYVNAASNDYNLIPASPGKGTNSPKVSDMGPYGLPDPSGGGGAAVFNPLAQTIIKPA